MVCKIIYVLCFGRYTCFEVTVNVYEVKCEGGFGFASFVVSRRSSNVFCTKSSGCTTDPTDDGESVGGNVCYGMRNF